jgi:hypothetical protein
LATGEDISALVNSKSAGKVFNEHVNASETVRDGRKQHLEAHLLLVAWGTQRYSPFETLNSYK